MFLVKCVFTCHECDQSAVVFLSHQHYNVSITQNLYPFKTNANEYLNKLMVIFINYRLLAT